MRFKAAEDDLITKRDTRESVLRWRGECAESLQLAEEKSQNLLKEKKRCVTLIARITAELYEVSTETDTDVCTSVRARA